MKKEYIRTPDGRILDFDKLNEVSRLSLDTSEEPILTANTPKELCDGFYVQIDDWNFDRAYLFDNLEDAIEYFEDWQSYSDRKGLEYEIFIYGFIKTSKGLIYVAKLNEKGELVLI